MTEAQLITPPISITGKGRVMRDKGREGGGRLGGDSDKKKKMKGEAGCNKGANEE